MTEILIKNFKHSEFNSDETHCFQAAVYVDGKRGFIAGNCGHGGCNDYQVLNQELFDTASLYADALPAEPYDYGEGFKGEMQPDLDTVIGDLVIKELMRRDRKKAYNKGVAFITDDPEKIEWYAFPPRMKKAEKDIIRARWESQIMAKNPEFNLIKSDGSLTKGG